MNMEDLHYFRLFEGLDWVNALTFASPQIWSPLLQQVLDQRILLVFRSVFDVGF